MQAARTDASLSRVLGVWDLVVYGMVFMLPIAPFALYGIVDRASHGQVPLAYLLGAAVMILPARSYAELGAAFPVAGSVYSYTRQGINATAGFFAGWLILLDYAVAPGLLYIASAAALHSLMPLVQRWQWILVFVAIGTGTNLAGLKITAAANKTLLVSMLAVLAVFLSAGMLALHAGKGHAALTLNSLFDAKRFSWHAMVSAVLLSSTSFLGFDAITTLGEEFKGGERRQLGRAGFMTLAIIALLFVAQTWLASDLAPGARILSDDSAFYDIAGYAAGHWLFTLTTVATALSWGIACAIVCQSAIARILFAMGRDHELPHVLSKLHPVTRQPYVANLVVGVASLALALGFQDRFDEIVLFQNFGAMSAFLFVNAAVIGHFWVKQRTGLFHRHLALPALGIMVVTVLLLSMRSTTLELGCVWLAAGSGYFFFRRRLWGNSNAIR